MCGVAWSLGTIIGLRIVQYKQTADSTVAQPIVGLKENEY